MLPLRLFRIPAFAAGNGAAFLMIGSLFAATFFVSQYFQFALGYSPLATGVRLLPWTLTPIFIAPVAGALSDRIGRRPLVVAGLALQAVGFVWIALVGSRSVSYLQLVPPLIVAGVGIWAAIPVVPTATINAVPADGIGIASGANSTMQRFGSVFAIAIASAVFQAWEHLGTGERD